jgi:hypothetical protein
MSKPGPRASSLSAYLREQAGLRQATFEECRDRRSQRAARSIAQLADYVATLPEDDPRLSSLEAANCLHDGIANLGELANHHVSRYGYAELPQAPGPFLTFITKVAIEEAVLWMIERAIKSEDPLAEIVMGEDDERY